METRACAGRGKVEDRVARCALAIWHGAGHGLALTKKRMGYEPPTAVLHGTCPRVEVGDLCATHTSASSNACTQKGKAHGLSFVLRALTGRKEDHTSRKRCLLAKHAKPTRCRPPHPGLALNLQRARAAAPLLLRPTPPPPPPDHHHRAPPTPTPPITGHRLLPQNPLAEEQHQTPSPSIHQRGRDDDGRPAPQAGGPGAAPPRCKQRRRQPRGRREPHRIHPKGHPHGVRAGDPTPVRPSFPHPYPTQTITPSPTPPTPTPNPAATRS